MSDFDREGFLSRIFGNSSGATILNEARAIAERALDHSPEKDNTGKTLKDDNGSPYYSSEAAKAKISDAEARITKDLTRREFGTSNKKSVQNDIDELRKHEVARVCVDILTADEHNGEAFLTRRLTNALAGRNETGIATSTTFQNKLNGSLTESGQGRVHGERVTVRAEMMS